MRRCPSCSRKWAYKLSDGRFKCRSCGYRYSWHSVWDSSRLSESTKTRLVELFALGVPVYRQRFQEDASSSAKERFYRLIRACCAHEEQLTDEFVRAMECDETTFGAHGKGKRGTGRVIIFGLIQREGTVKAVPIARHRRSEVISRIRDYSLPGSLYFTNEWQAYATFRLQGEHVVVRKEKGRSKGRNHIEDLEGFWSFAKNWLTPFRGVPRKFFHLYLGEICYRFNHRKEDIKPLIIKKLKATGIQEIRPLLVRKG